MKICRHCGNEIKKYEFSVPFVIIDDKGNETKRFYFCSRECMLAYERAFNRRKVTAMAGVK